MTVRLPSPTTASRTRMTVSSGWNSREVSLNGRLIGVTDSTPGSAARRLASTCFFGPTSPTTDDNALLAGVVVWRHPLGQDLALDARISASLAPMAITTIIDSVSS